MCLQVVRCSHVPSYLAMSPNVDTVKKMQREMEASYNAGTRPSLRALKPAGHPNAVLSHARFPGEKSSQDLIAAWASDPDVPLEVAFPTHNRYARQLHTAVQNERTGLFMNNALVPAKIKIATAPSQRLEDGFLSEAINRLCLDTSDSLADCEGYPVFEDNSEVDERFAFLMDNVRYCLKSGLHILYHLKAIKWAMYYML